MYCVSSGRKRDNFLFACCVWFSLCFCCLSVSLLHCFPVALCVCVSMCMCVCLLCMLSLCLSACMSVHAWLIFCMSVLFRLVGCVVIFLLFSLRQFSKSVLWCWNNKASYLYVQNSGAKVRNVLLMWFRGNTIDKQSLNM